MQTYNFNVTQNDALLGSNVTAGDPLVFNITNPTVGVSYFGLQTVPNSNGFYDDTSPKNLQGTFTRGVGILDVVSDEYQAVAAVIPGVSQLTLTPSNNIQGTALRVKGITATLSGSLTNLFKQYQIRVQSSSGYVDPNTETCVNGASDTLKQAPFLIIPSGYGTGSVFAQNPDNGNGDLTFTRASSATRVDFGNIITTVSNSIARLDYSQGNCPALLLEPQRTNSIRNSTMVGTVAGTPGTLPTNYNTLTRNLTRQIIGTGSLNGVNYIDIRFFGTSNDSVNPVRLGPEAFTGTIVAIPNQRWTSTVWFDILDETLPAGSYFFAIEEKTSTGTFISEVTASLISGFTRNSLSRILSSPTAGRVGTDYRFGVTSGSNYDFTVRIGGPQLELGAYATALIPTTNATATRLADSFTRNNIFTNGLITSAGGTWFVELRNNVEYIRDTASFPLFISSTSTSGASSNSLEIRNASPTIGRLQAVKRVAGVGTALFGTTSNTVKIAFKWNGTTADVFVNGVKEVFGTAFTTTNMEFLNGFGIDVPLFIQQMALYPSPLSDAECVSLTTL